MNSKTVLSGSLTFLNLGDLLQLLSTDNRSGVLRISHPSKNAPGIIYIKEGNPVDSLADKLTGKEAMYSLFGWIDGSFEFSEEESKREDAIKQRMMAVVLDALRVLDEGDIEKLSIPSLKPDGKEASKQKKDSNVIKGPFIEYSSVVDEDEYTDGTRIVIQGKHGNWLWVILEGIVEIIKKTDRGETVISKVGAGAFIGGLSTILQPENNRSATAIAKGMVQLGVIDTQQLISEMSYCSLDFKQMIISLDNRLRKITSRLADIKSGADKFKGLPRNIKPMIGQGDEVQKVFKILNGEAFLVRNTTKGMVFLMKLEKGDFIGKIPLFDIDHEPASASVFASEDLKLGIIDTSLIDEEYNKLSVTTKNIIQYTTICISATTSEACS